MQNELERLIKVVFRAWKAGRKAGTGGHPDEETLACFVEGRLPPDETERAKLHLIDCAACFEKAAAHAGLKSAPLPRVPAELIQRAKDLARRDAGIPVLEIALRLGEKILEVLNTTGDILLGQELVPAPQLRERHPADFKDEITILKDFPDLRVEVRIEKKQAQSFTLVVMAKDKGTGRIIKDLRITLLSGDTELESYVAETGAVTFEHVLLGKYTVELTDIENKVASVVLDIKK